MMKIFVMASGRSGTKYLSDLFQHNVERCVAKHEPYLGMFGKPIYWYQQGDVDRIKQHFSFKKKLITRYRADVYIETNHAFLKSFADVALEAFPDAKLIHLIRNPLEVAKSQYHRPVWIGEPDSLWFRLFHTYMGEDNKRYLDWTLTGKEQIFKDISLDLTRYQLLLVQWIELENRAMSLLETYHKHHDCFTLETPKDLNDEERLTKMFSFLGITLKQNRIILQGKKNTAKTPTQITTQDTKQLQELIDHIPTRYLKIFCQDPYKSVEWGPLLQK